MTENIIIISRIARIVAITLRLFYAARQLGLLNSETISSTY